MKQILPKQKIARIGIYYRYNSINENWEVRLANIDYGLCNGLLCVEVNTEKEAKRIASTKKEFEVREFERFNINLSF